MDGFADIVFSPVGAVVYVALVVRIVADHVRFLISERVLDRAATVRLLLYDLTGFALVWGWIEHLSIGPLWLRWLLGVHIVVHLLSLVWTLAHFQSLYDFMVRFQRRETPRALTWVMVLYEQSDPAIYLWLAAILIADMPAELSVPMFVVLAGVAVARFGPRRDAAAGGVA